MKRLMTILFVLFSTVLYSQNLFEYQSPGLDIDGAIQLPDLSGLDDPDADNLRIATQDDNGKSILMVLDEDSTWRRMGDAIYVARNETGGQLTKGTVVHYKDTADPNGVMMIEKATNNNQKDMPAEAVVIEDVGNNGYGLVAERHELRNIDTDSLVVGTDVYVGQSGAYTEDTPQVSNGIYAKE